MIVSPETVVRWHRSGFAMYWRAISRGRRIVGRRRTSEEVREERAEDRLIVPRDPIGQINVEVVCPLIGEASCYSSQRTLPLVDGEHTALSDDDYGQDYRPVEATEQRHYWQRQDASGQHGPNCRVQEFDRHQSVDTPRSVRHFATELYTMKHHIFVTVQGGVAEVCEDTLPPGVTVEVLDFDNFAADERSKMSHWSPKLREYWKRNRKSWGRRRDVVRTLVTSRRCAAVSNASISVRDHAGFVGIIVCVQKLGFRFKLVPVLANCDPLLHIVEFDLLHPGILWISCNRVAQFGSKLFQFHEAHLIQSSHKPHFNPKGQTECLKLGRLNCKRRHRETFHSLILTQPEGFSLQ